MRRYRAGGRAIANATRPWFDPTYGEVRRGMEIDEPEPYDETPASHVYFVLDADAAQIKIGYTARSPQRRLIELQSQRGRKLDLLGSLPGGFKLEKALLSRFKDYRREGQEWFSSEIIADVAELLA